jgi:hypothetical protein
MTVGTGIAPVLPAAGAAARGLMAAAWKSVGVRTIAERVDARLPITAGEDFHLALKQICPV